MYKHPIKTAICSFGMSGQVFHAPFIHAHPGFQFYAVWERSKRLAQERYPGVLSYSSLDAMLADPEVELVIVNTPNYLHYEHARAALNAGKHVIVEKPFTVSSAEGIELKQLAESKGLLLSVYHNRRFDSDYSIVKQVAESGWLGEIYEAEFHYDRFKEELSYKKHKEEKGPGTGALYDLGSHLIDQALTLFGLPEKIWADIQILRKDSVVDDYFELVLFYGKRRVRLKCSYLIRESVPAYALHGRLGSFLKSKSDVQEAMLQKGLRPDSPDWGVEAPCEWGLLHTEKEGRVVKEFLPSPAGNYMGYFDAIYKAMRENGSNPVPAQDAVNIIRVIETAFTSAAEGRVVDFL